MYFLLLLSSSSFSTPMSFWLAGIFILWLSPLIFFTKKVISSASFPVFDSTKKTVELCLMPKSLIVLSLSTASNILLAANTIPRMLVGYLPLLVCQIIVIKVMTFELLGNVISYLSPVVDLAVTVMSDIFCLLLNFILNTQYVISDSLALIKGFFQI